jgi:hypothetical protein
VLEEDCIATLLMMLDSLLNDIRLFPAVACLPWPWVAGVSFPMRASGKPGRRPIEKEVAHGIPGR